MKRTSIIVLALLVGFWVVPTDTASAQGTKWVRGTVTAVSDSSITVKALEKEYTFTVDQKSEVIARGAGTKARQAAKEGQPGIKLTDSVKVGDGVEVRYHDMGGTLHAATIRAGIDVGVGSTSDQATKHADGTVSAVSGSSLTIKSGDKELRFNVDRSTRIIGRGVGTLSREKQEAGAGLKITDAVGEGDTVSVSYHDMGGTLHAAEIRVTRKAKT